MDRTNRPTTWYVRAHYTSKEGVGQIGRVPALRLSLLRFVKEFVCSGSGGANGFDTGNAAS
jgi:hypothetical protein